MAKIHMILQGKAKYPVEEVILHCGALKTGQFEGMSPFQMFATVNQWHRERAIRRIGGRERQAGFYCWNRCSWHGP